MGFPPDHMAGALKMVKDPKLAPPVKAAFDKCRDKPINYMESYSETDSAASRKFAAESLASAFDQKAKRILDPYCIAKKRPTVKLNGKGYIAMAAMLEKMFGDFFGTDDEYYDSQIKAAQMKYLTEVKKQTGLSQSTSSMYNMCFA